MYEYLRLGRGEIKILDVGGNTDDSTNINNFWCVIGGSCLYMLRDFLESITKSSKWLIRLRAVFS